ncbi:MAG: 23S rRNA (guanosine(2251)-2'-O)-methyltransferase RlmB [Alphaproteobacteria bacterium]
MLPGVFFIVMVGIMKVNITKTKQASRLVIYGWHACKAAIHNPNRKIYRILLVNEQDAKPLLDGLAAPAAVEIVERRFLQQLLGPDAVHQGIACELAPLPALSLSVLEGCAQENQIVVCLDQVTDPHNVGAILRSCAAFGAKALILTERHAPMETAALLKAASGAFEAVPLIRIVNLAQALKELQSLGFWTCGFAEDASQSLNAINLKGKMAFVLGSEGDGLRRLTRENLDFLVRLPTQANFTTLNVSIATAVSLYEAFRQHTT